MVWYHYVYLLSGVPPSLTTRKIQLGPQIYKESTLGFPMQPQHTSSLPSLCEWVRIAISKYILMPSDNNSCSVLAIKIENCIWIQARTLYSQTHTILLILAISNGMAKRCSFPGHRIYSLQDGSHLIRDYHAQNVMKQGRFDHISTL